MQKSVKTNWCAVLIFSVIGLISCNKKEDSPPVENEELYQHGDLYFAGIEWLKNIPRPYYYKNHDRFPLEVPEGMMAKPTDIATDGDRVYVVGTAESVAEHDAGEKKWNALLWTDGSWMLLETPPAKLVRVQGIALQGEDVYAVGFYLPVDGSPYQRGVIWKNGVCHPVTDGSVSTTLSDLFVTDSGDIYVVGYENNGGKITSKYWKNGHPVTLSDPHTTTYANSIFVDQNQVYAAGFSDALDDRSLKLWRNGQASSLISSTPVVRGATVVVDQSTVYTIGYLQEGSKYIPLAFQNDAPLALVDENDGHTYTRDLHVFNEDVLVLGNYATDRGDQPVLWINGKPKKLLSSDASTLLVAFDLVPKEH